jgi:hypothetical protein
MFCGDQAYFDQQDAALRAAKANLDRILRFAGKPK